LNNKESEKKEKELKELNNKYKTIYKKLMLLLQQFHKCLLWHNHIHHKLKQSKMTRKDMEYARFVVKMINIYRISLFHVGIMGIALIV